MHVTICITTRDRGASILRTVRSLLALSYPDWDAVIVDQSRTEATARAVQAAIGGDPRFRYIGSTTIGSSAARNLALAHARGPFIAFTDDDCEVSPEWLERLVAYYRRYPESGLIFGAVLAGPHDPRAGFIPTAPITRFRRIAAPSLKWREQGIGANMAAPLDVLRRVGGFDEVLGSGAPLRANLDGDLAYRVLKAGYAVLNVPDAVVIHHGFRTWQQGRRLMRGVGIGVGATYMKHIRLGDSAVLPTFVIEWLRCIAWGRLLTLRRHVGLGRFLGFMLGLVLSFRYPIDRRTRAYRAPRARNADEVGRADQRVRIPPIIRPLGPQRPGPGPVWAHVHAHIPLHAAAPLIAYHTSAWVLLLIPLVYIVACRAGPGRGCAHPFSALDLGVPR